MSKNSMDLTQGPLLGGIIRYTVPIILTSIIQLLFNAADLVVVGNFCGGVSVAAVGATSSLTNLFVNIFLGLSVGAGVAVAHGLGEQDDEEVHRTVHTAIPMALLSGIVLTILGMSFSEAMLKVMSTPDNVLPLSAVYMRIYFAGITFTVLYNYCASILRAGGDTKSPLFFLMISGVINVVLNIIFVTVFHMDVAGVALATIISQGVSAMLVMIALMRRKDACRLMLRKMCFYKEQLFKVLRIGVPAGIQSSLFSISNVIIQSSVNSFGDIFMSGASAASSIEGFVYVMQNAFHQTTVNYVGQNTGARNYKRVKQTVWTCIGCVTAIGIAAGSIAYLFGPQLLGLYLKDSPQAVSDGMIKLLYVCLPYFLCGLMEVSSGALRGMGASVPPMVISVLGVCGIRIGWIYTVFAAIHTPQALFISYPISWIATFIIQMLVFFKIFKRFVSEDQHV